MFTENSPEHLRETWDIHNRINLYTIEAIEQEDLKDAHGDGHKL